MLGIAAASLLPGSARAADDFGKMLESFVKPTGGELGFAIYHPESGKRFFLRGSERFPMASVYKLPIAIAVLHQVERQEISPSQKVRITPAGLRLGLGTNEVAELVGDSGYDFSVEELLHRMLVDSDNASSDALLRLMGATTVTKRIRELGIEGIRIDRSEAELLLDFVGASSVEPAEGWSVAELRRRYGSVTPEMRKAALERFLRDPRDTATPEAMVALLEKVHRKEVLGPEGSNRLLGLLRETRTGKARLRGQLPAQTVFAHRTGTSDTTDGVTGVTNDVGILTLPNGKGHLVMAAFLRKAKGSMAEREAVLAKIGRAVYDAFV
jgi:beta-lactamase class A